MCCAHLAPITSAQRVTIRTSYHFGPTLWANCPSESPASQSVKASNYSEPEGMTARHAWSHYAAAGRHAAVARFAQVLPYHMHGLSTPAPLLCKIWLNQGQRGFPDYRARPVTKQISPNSGTRGEHMSVLWSGMVWQHSSCEYCSLLALCKPTPLQTPSIIIAALTEFLRPAPHQHLKLLGCCPP